MKILIAEDDAVSARIMKAAKVVDPSRQEARDEIRFGARVELADEHDHRREHLLTVRHR